MTMLGLQQLQRGMDWADSLSPKLSINTLSLCSHHSCRGLAVTFPTVQLEGKKAGRWEGLGELAKTSAKQH